MGMDLIPFEESERGIAATVAATSAQIATPGHVFTGAWLEEALDLGAKPTQTAEYEQWSARRARLFAAWRTELLTEHRIHVEDHAPRGYIVIAAAETPFVAVKLASREVRKAIQQASDKIQFAPSSLTAIQRQHRLDALAYLGKVKLALEHARPKPPRPGRAAPAE